MVPKEGSSSIFEFQKLKHYDASMQAVYFVRIRYLQISAFEVSGFVKQHCLTLCSLLSIDLRESIFTLVESKSIHFPNSSFNVKPGTRTAGI